MGYKSDCIFCKIANKEIESNYIAENKYAIAFMDIQPVSPGHILIIPKEHYDDFSSCDEKYLIGVTLLAKEIAKKVAHSELNPKGFNYLSNEKSIAGQVVNHFHLHIIPKYTKTKGFSFDAKNDESIKIETTLKKIKNSSYIIE